MAKNLPAMWETWVRSLGQEDHLEEKTATHSSILAWRIPWTEEPGGLQSMGLQSVGHNWATNTFIFFLVNYETWGWFWESLSPNMQLVSDGKGSPGNCALKHCSLSDSRQTVYTHALYIKKSKEGIHLKMEGFPPFSGFTTSSSLGIPLCFFLVYLSRHFLNKYKHMHTLYMCGTSGKESSGQCTRNRRCKVQSLNWEDALEEKMAPYSSILAWKIPRAEEPGRLQSMVPQRVGHDWAHTRFIIINEIMLYSPFWNSLLSLLFHE